MFSNTNRKIHRRKELAPKVIQIYTQSNSTKKSFHVPLSSLQKSELSVSRDKGQRSRFQNKFYATLIFTAMKERKIMLMALSKHIPEIERQSYTLYRKKSVHMLQSWTKLLKHLANFHFFSQHSSVLQPRPPHFNVVNALVVLKQSLLNRKPQETTLSRGGGG